MTRRAHGRCPRCGKVRKLWMRANEWSDQRVSSQNIAGEGNGCVGSAKLIRRGVQVCRVPRYQIDSISDLLNSA